MTAHIFQALHNVGFWPTTTSHHKCVSYEIDIIHIRDSHKSSGIMFFKILIQLHNLWRGN